jgi:hypothetical protein
VPLARQCDDAVDDQREQDGDQDAQRDQSPWLAIPRDGLAFRLLCVLAVIGVCRRASTLVVMGGVWGRLSLAVAGRVLSGFAFAVVAAVSGRLIAALAVAAVAGRLVVAAVPRRFIARHGR